MIISLETELQTFYKNIMDLGKADYSLCLTDVEKSIFDVDIEGKS